METKSEIKSIDIKVLKKINLYIDKIKYIIELRDLKFDNILIDKKIYDALIKEFNKIDIISCYEELNKKMDIILEENNDKIKCNYVFEEIYGDKNRLKNSEIIENEYKKILNNISTLQFKLLSN